jgi:very-short-patch-repair endonuclease
MKIEKDIFIAYIKQTVNINLIAEYKFHKTRKWRFDFVCLEHKLAIECDGAVWANGRHTRGSGYVGDMEKFNQAALYGFRVLKFQPKEMLTLQTAELIKECCTNNN